MCDQLVIIGGGGHAKVCYEIAIEMDRWNKIIILDDHSENDTFEISGTLEDILKYKDCDFFVAIGNNETRKKIIEEKIGELSLISLIHPKSIISRYAQIDVGTVIMPGVVINANTKIGKGSIINTSSTVDHDGEIGEYVHISPGVHIAGNVKIFKNTWIGIGTIVKNNVKIDKNIIVGANSTVLDNLENSGIYYGSPATWRVKKY